MVKTSVCKMCKYANCALVEPVIVSQADVVIVGEAPGEEEVRSGIPFTGVSGRVLRNALRDTGFDISKIAITNTVKCRPPDNETPKDHERDTCARQFLFKEIESIRPRVIVCAGAVATSMFPDTAWQGIPVVNILHPAAILYMPEKESRFRIDLRKLYNRLYPKAVEKILRVVQKIEDIQEFMSWVTGKPRLACDIETNGTLDPFNINAKITHVSFGCDNTAYSIIIDNDKDPLFVEQAVKIIRGILADPTVTKIFHRSWFDVKFLQSRNMPVVNFDDTRAQAFLLNENRPEIGLKELVAENFGEYDHKMNESDKYENALYNAEDSYYTYNLDSVQRGRMTLSLRKVLEKIMLPAVPVLNEMMLTGMCIDQEYAKNLRKEIIKERDSVHAELLQKYRIFRGINLASTPQMQAVLFGALKEKPLKETKTGYSVDEETLNSYAYEGKEWARMLVSMRQKDKLLSTYVEKIPKMVNYDGRIRTQFDLANAVTGRLSSAKPNLQNIPRDNKIYRMFVAGKGKMFLYFDFSQLELRTAASIAPDRKMIDAYSTGADLHVRTAMMITGKKAEDIQDNERQLAKGTGFGLIYGQGAEGLRRYLFDKYGIDVTMEEAERIRGIFFSEYNGLPLWHKRVERELHSTHQVVYPTGRVRRFPQIKVIGKVPGDIYRSGVNAPNQGAACDCVLFAMWNVYRLIKKRRLPVKFVEQVHDMVMMELDDDIGIAEEVKDITTMVIHEVLPNDELFRWLKVPLDVEFKIGPTWGDLKKFGKSDKK